MNVLPVELRAADDRIDGSGRDALRPRSRGREELVVSMREMVGVVTILVAAVVTVAIFALGLSAVAHAEPAQQVSFQMSGSEPGGQLSFHLRLRAYDTTGGVPPRPTTFHLRLPRGARVRSEFLDKSWFCDGPALRDTLDARPSPVPFNTRVGNLRPLIRELERSRAKRDRKALPNVRACERGRLGAGTGEIDARNVSDLLADPIPVKFALFLSRGEVPGAIAGFTTIGAADEHAAIVRRFPVVGGVHAAINESIVDDPTPDGAYGYKLLLPTGRLGGFDIRIAKIDATVRALKLAKGTCLRRGRGDRCTRRQPSDLYSFVAPSCPPSGQLSAQLFAAFPPPTSSITTTIPLPCPRYS